MTRNPIAELQRGQKGEWGGLNWQGHTDGRTEGQVVADIQKSRWNINIKNNIGKVRPPASQAAAFKRHPNAAAVNFTPPPSFHPSRV